MLYRLAIPALLLCLAVPQIFAQKKPALPAKYAKWLNEEVVYIITDDERKEFLQLATDEKRDEFIKVFWDIRNPVRGAEPNRFKEEHYARIEYANENFGRQTGTPGWRTDMGRTWILFGKPASRTPYKGYSDVYPMEVWFYENRTASPSLPSFFNVLFFIPEDIGEYRFYHPIIDGPLKLVRGTRFQTNKDVYNYFKQIGGDLARVPFTPTPGEPIDTENYSPSMTGEMVVSKILEFRNDPFEVRRIRETRFLRERVNSWLLLQDQRPLDLSYIVLTDPIGQRWLDYSVLVDQERIGRADPSGDNLIVNAGFRLLTDDGKLIVEDQEERAYPAFEKSGNERKFHAFLLSNRVAMVPGKYRLEVVLSNREAGRTFQASTPVVVTDASQPQIAGPVLATAARQVTAPDANTPFQYFGVQFIPDTARHFSPGATIRSLFQIGIPDPAAEKYELESVLASVSSRDVRNVTTDPLSPQEFNRGVLLKSKSFPLTGFPAGEYRMIFNLKRTGSPEVLASAAAPFRITEESAEPALYFLRNFRSAAAPAVAAYIRGLEALSEGRPDEAATYLHGSVEQAPSNTFAVTALTQIYFDRHKFSDITALFQKVGIAALSGDPATVAAVALSFWETGDADRARRVLAAGNERFPKNALLLAAAKKIDLQH